MCKYATTIDEQIDILQSRGMIIEDIAKAKEILLDIGYFRLGFYWFPFEKTYPKRGKRRMHDFVVNTKFEDIKTLYYFDQDLRLLLSKYIFRIEIDFRTFLIYTASNKYKTMPTWFAESKCVSKKYIEDLPKYYEDIKKNNAIIQHHHRKHTNDIHAPAWKTIECMTFGNVLTLYSNLNDSGLKQDIALHYGIKNVKIFENYMDTVRVIRNQCAHGRNLYDFKLRNAILKGPVKNIKDEKIHNICGALYVILFILGKISANRENELRNSVKELIQGVPNISTQINHLCEMEL
ncbi:MAG: Abi family protein [Bacteroidales bacterium]|nr:Abi family protein [Bacteroidales bacterium]